jgi:ATP-binding protein involved in chromosome partitioning
MVRKLAMSCIKGGVGKTTCSCGIAQALQRRGYKVGIVEIDITGSSLWKALGLKEPPPLQTDTAREKILPSVVNGIEVFTIASYYKARGILILPGEDSQIEVNGKVITLKGTGKYNQVGQMLATVAFSGDLDYLVYDLPPNYGDDMRSLWDNVGDPWGVIIISQPTSLSEEGLAKTLDMLKFKQLPLLGLIVNMDGVECPQCGTHFNPFLDTENLENAGLPIIERIPFTKDPVPYFDKVAAWLEKARPQKLGELSMTQKLIRRLEKGVGTAIAPTIAKHAIKKGN